MPTNAGHVHLENGEMLVQCTACGISSYGMIGRWTCDNCLGSAYTAPISCITCFPVMTVDPGQYSTGSNFSIADSGMDIAFPISYAEWVRQQIEEDRTLQRMFRGPSRRSSQSQQAEPFKDEPDQ